MSWQDILKNKSKIAFPEADPPFNWIKSYIVDGKEVITMVYTSKEAATPKDDSGLKYFLEQNGGYSVQQLEVAHEAEDGRVFDWYVVLERRN